MQSAPPAIHAIADDIPGWLAPGDVDLLHHYACVHGRTILEVGSFRGKSTTVLLLGALSKRSTCALYTIDNQAGHSLATYETLVARRIDQHALFLTGTLADVAEEDGNSFSPSLIFIDADHSYEGAKADTETLSRIARPQTPILFHDYRNPDTPGVTQAVDEWIADGYATMIDHVDCIVAVRATERCQGRDPVYRKFLRAPVGIARLETRRDRIARNGIVGAALNSMRYRLSKYIR